MKTNYIASIYLTTGLVLFSMPMEAVSCEKYWNKDQYSEIRKNEKRLGIPDLKTEAPAEELKELRIWREDNRIDTATSGIVLSNREGEWKLSKILRYKPEHIIQKDNSDDSLSRLWGYLEGNGFFGLPDDCYLEKKVAVMDGEWYFVEYRIGSEYRYFTYWNPKSHPDLYEARQFTGFLEKIDNVAN